MAETELTAQDLENAVCQVECAKLAEQLERYDDMAKHMKKAAEYRKKERVEAGSSEEIFTSEERNLFSVAYKNVVGSKRSSYRQIQAIETHKPAQEAIDQRLAKFILKTRKEEIIEELEKVCNEVLALIQDQLIESASNAETKVFYNKMKGDYYRYLAEVVTTKESKDNAVTAYDTALATAKAELTPTHPIRLGLALNYSVFFYEIMNKPEEACALAKQAFDDAISELDTLKEDSYKDSTLIMQLLRDNLTLWTTDPAAPAGEEENAE